MIIYWHQFDWQSFATLMTGLAAVAGAIWVGRRQADIAQLQAEIQARQVALSELTLRSDLFERRWAVYETTREFLAEIMRTAEEPDREHQLSFLIGLNKAEFLFAPSVKSDLQDIWKRSCGFFAVKKMSSYSFQTTGAYGQDNIERETEYLTWLADVLGRLADVFGDELKLSGSATPTPHPPPRPSPPSPAGSAPRP